MKLATAIVSACLLATSAFSAPVDSEKRQSFPTTALYDDADQGLTYSSGWTHLTNQGHNLYDKTESYTGVNGQVTVYSPTSEGQTATLTIWSTKKQDRGAFNIYCGHTLIGSGNQYAAGGETDTQVVAKLTGIDCGSYVVIKNDRGAKYMGLDRLEFSGFNEP